MKTKKKKGENKFAPVRERKKITLVSRGFFFNFQKKNHLREGEEKIHPPPLIPHETSCPPPQFSCPSFVLVIFYWMEPVKVSMVSCKVNIIFINLVYTQENDALIFIRK